MLSGKQKQKKKTQNNNNNKLSGFAELHATLP
jgi:hypothetical protein